MPAQLLLGRDVASLRKEQIKLQVAALIQEGKRAPCLAVILIGHDPASEIYVAHKQRACHEVGISSEFHALDDTITEAELITLIDQLNTSKNIDGILVQLPLPAHLKTLAILERISPQKDVDGFHPYNLGRLAQANPALRPCTPYGIMNLLQHYKINVKGMNATVVGSSNIVGRPMALELLMAGATVTICHRHTRDLEHAVRHADLLVSATGKQDVVKSEWIKPGAVVIDVGITRLPDGTLCGDINMSSAAERASYLTPVPGGVGPMTVCTLLENTVKAAKMGSGEVMVW